jgi:hypothetical protein
VSFTHPYERYVMRSIGKALCVVVACLGATFASAQDESYMALVGDLISKAEGPLFLQELCDEVTPENAAANAEAYKGWRARNAVLLAQVQTHREHADKRLVRKAATAKVRVPTMNEMSMWSKQIFAEEMQSRDPAEMKAICAGYSETLPRREAALVGEIRRLLATVMQAYEELSRLEAAK